MYFGVVLAQRHRRVELATVHFAHVPLVELAVLRQSHEESLQAGSGHSDIGAVAYWKVLRQGARMVSRNGATTTRWFRASHPATRRSGFAIPTGSELSAQRLSRSDYPGNAMPTHRANPEGVASDPRVALEVNDSARRSTPRIQRFQR